VASFGLERLGCLFSFSHLLQETISPRTGLHHFDSNYVSIQGGIAYSATSDINYNTGAATAIGFGVGFLCALSQMGFKRKFNHEGVIDSNSVVFHFLIPSFFAAIFVAIAQGIHHTSATYTDSSGTTVVYNQVVQAGRTA
jgi:hypothetical protein